MPWELFSRLRRSVRRQPASGPPLQDVTPQLQQGHPAPQLPVDRRILQDPSSYLEAVAQPEPLLPHALTPSTRLPSASGGRRVHSRPRPIDLTVKPLSERSDPLGSPVDISPQTQSRFRISKIASGSEWSTFGRKREHRAADVAGVSGRTSALDNPKGAPYSPSPTNDNKHRSADSTLSMFTPSRITNLCVTQGEHSSPGTRSPGQPPDVYRSSPTDTTSSTRHPQTPQGPSSYTTPVAAHATSPGPVNREFALDSPHTFGHPTPPNNSVEFSAAHPSPPPPLPPLNHPELFSWRRRSASIGRPTSTTPRDRSNTLPTNGRSPLFSSLSLKLRHSVRHQAKHAFDAAMTEQPNSARRRARTMSASGQRRRTSADWSSHEASVGVNSWPAEVSREMLRLALQGTESVPGSLDKHKRRTRDRVTDPGSRSDAMSSSPSFLPFPRPSRKSQNTASATLKSALEPWTHAAPEPCSDRREVLLPRPHSLQFHLGNSKGSRQPVRFSMAEVKRSASAVEPRNRRNNEAGGVNYSSSGLSDPAQSQAPHPSPFLHPSSALTSSRSLPSGRTSPPNTPMSSSVLGEPSTPTPAPRHSSDRSRGKRKAEDNIDLTPPEQKKEGQRATFLLPDEPRSQRISSSSHAPSSYRRKRARLSSTSPFATPVQSRPSSVHETPRSTGRSHHFASLSSSTGARMALPRTPSRAASTHSRQPPTPSTTRKHERHQSMSQMSIPISAIVSPHAPSVSRSAKFHMRDPRKPPKKPGDTSWGLRFATEDEPGSPIQAWCFFFGFLLFPIWWIAGLFLGIPKTRIAGDVDAEKGVAIDDPQIEHDARIWRFRCRVMAVVSLFTYVPFIVLVAIFAPR